MKLVLIIVLIYVNLSAIEYISHRWIMHNSSVLTRHFQEEHDLHHITVKPDMSLDVSLLEDKQSGLFFHYEGTFMYAIVLYVLFSIQFKYLKINIGQKQKIYLILLIVISYSLIANSLHLEMHDEKDIILSSTRGISNTYQNTVVKYIPSFWIKYIISNHHSHHRYKSTTNFNFILPMFDHVMGTYAI